MSSITAPRSKAPIASPAPRAKRCLLRAVAADGCSRSNSPTKKKMKALPTTVLPASPLPWLRSGRTFTHPLVVEAVTMQVASLADFELALPDPCSGTSSAVSSQRTVTEPSSPATPTTPKPSRPKARLLCPMPPRSGSTPFGQDVCRPPALSRLARTVSPALETPSRIPLVPEWFASCFDESDGYDSDAIAVIAGVQKPVSLASSPISSPGFTLVGDTSLSSLGNVWEATPWPDDVQLLTGQRNPHNWKFVRVATGVNGGVGCGCSARCNALSCANAKASRFCTINNCAFAGHCGNALNESSALALRRNVRTGMRGVVATRAIPAGEVIGQYLGHMQLLGPPCRNAAANEGYRMHLKTRTSGNKFVGIDALEDGGMMRMVNHSCNASARFYEVQTGAVVTVVAVTIRDVYPGDEVTVSYGDRLWFVCRCGWWGCQHRDLQHLPGTEAA